MNQMPQKTPNTKGIPAQFSIIARLIMMMKAMAFTMNKRMTVTTVPSFAYP